jgi:hypothetical protein
MTVKRMDRSGNSKKSASASAMLIMLRYKLGIKPPSLDCVSFHPISDPLPYPFSTDFLCIFDTKVLQNPSIYHHGQIHHFRLHSYSRGHCSCRSSNFLNRPYGCIYGTLQRSQWPNSHGRRWYLSHRIRRHQSPPTSSPICSRLRRPSSSSAAEPSRCQQHHLPIPQQHRKAKNRWHNCPRDLGEFPCLPHRQSRFRDRLCQPLRHECATQPPSCQRVLGCHPRQTHRWPHPRNQPGEFGKVVGMPPPQKGPIPQVNATLEYFKGMLFPQGETHFQFNPTCEPALFAAGFDSNDPGRTQVARNFFSAYPDDVLISAVGGDLETLDPARIARFREQIPTAFAEQIESCVKRCNIAQK